MIRHAVAAAVLVGVLAIAGCSAPTLSGGTGGGGGSGGAGDSDTPGDGTAGGDTGTVEGGDTGTSDPESSEGHLPAGWPDEVVVAEGRIVQGVSMGGSGWLALVDADDPASGFAASSTALQAAGYTVVSEVVTETGSVGIYENAELQVQVAVAPSADAGWNMSYTINRK